MQKKNLSDIDVSLLEINRVDKAVFDLNRKTFVDNLKSKLDNFESKSVLVIKGGSEMPRYDTDVSYFYFQQDANFYYLTGVVDPDFVATINLTDNNYTLTLYTVDPSTKNSIYEKVYSLNDYKTKYGVDVFLNSKLNSDIAAIDPKKIYVLNGINSDSNLNIATADLNFPIPLNKYNKLVDYNTLVYEILADTRTKKSNKEIEIMTAICQATVDGHFTAIKSIKPGKTERDIEMKFYNHMRRNYRVRTWAYSIICGSGKNSATLHYDINDQTLRDYDLILVDMGVRIGGYCSDVTSTVPINGVFTDDQKFIYNTVYNANQAVINALKPGVNWLDMHLLAERVILKGLIDFNLLRAGYDIEDMISDRVAYYFMPHGLGHLIGLEVHDVGGYLSFTPPRSERKGLSSLRTARFIEEGNVITVEPGIYFIPYLLEQALSDDNLKKYFNEGKVRDFFNFGGVRIEDNVLVTAGGCINLTKDLPRKPEDIEKLMALN